MIINRSILTCIQGEEEGRERRKLCFLRFFYESMILWKIAREKLEFELEYYSCMGLGRSILVRVKIRKEHRSKHRSSANLFYRHALLPRKGSLRFHFQREIEFITPPPISSLSSAPEARKWNALLILPVLILAANWRLNFIAIPRRQNWIFNPWIEVILKLKIWNEVTSSNYLLKFSSRFEQ